MSDDPRRPAPTVHAGTDSRARLSPAVRGILWMLVATTFFSLNNAGVKWLAESYPIVQVLWARFFLGVLLFVLVLGRRSLAHLKTCRPGSQIARSLVLVANTSLFFYALSLLPLPEVAAVMFTIPLLVTALSVPLLKEPVGWRRWLGVSVGFLGALLVVRPGGALAQWAVLLPLGASVLGAAYNILTRLMGRSEHPLTTAMYTPLAGAIVYTLAVPFVWVTPDLEGALLMLGVAALATLGHWGLIKALEAAQAATIAPFQYTDLLWATFLGFALFGQWPEATTILGGAIIAVSGLYVLHRERVRAAQSRAAAAKDGR